MGHKELIKTEKEQLLQFLIVNSHNGKLLHGKINEAATRFDCGRRTVSRMWATAKQQLEKDEVIHVPMNRPGLKRKHEINLEEIQSIHYQKRGNIRDLAAEIKVPKTLVGVWAKKGLIRAHTSAIRPELTAPNKLHRLSFSLQAIEYDQMLNILKFKPMQNVVHIDEKWFYLTKKTHRYYMTPMEEDPYRSCKSKKFIPKVMFMCAVCRPLFGSDGSVIFDGKIGIWPFTQELEAKRKSKHRDKGTIEIKPIQSITKQVIKDCLLKQIMPAIKRVWPSSLSKVIFIQQDNAKPHIQDSDCDFRNAASSDGFEITLVQQPPNSPDTNVNDLGFFRAIQSIQQKHVCKNAPQLVDAVVSSFNQLEATTLNKVFLTLQSCMIEILKAKGHNNFKVPHMKKDALIRQNALPINLEVPEELVRQNINHLIEAGSAGGIAGLMTDLNMDGSAGGIAGLMTNLNMDGSAGEIAELMTDLNMDGV